SELTLDEVIEWLDADEPNDRMAAVAVLFGRGKAALLAARPVLRDVAWEFPLDVRGLVAAIDLIEDPEHPSKVLPAIRAAVDPDGKDAKKFSYVGKKRLSGDDVKIGDPNPSENGQHVFALRPAGNYGLAKNLGDIVAPGLIKALESSDAKESAAALDVLHF